MGVAPRLLTYLVYHIFSGVASWLCCGLLASAVSKLSPGGSVGFLGVWLHLRVHGSVAQGSPLEGASSKGLREGFAATIYLAQQCLSGT